MKPTVMPLIQDRDVPDHIYRLLAEQSARERRSLAQQVIAVLAHGLQVEVDAKARRRVMLEAIRSGSAPLTREVSDPVRLIRGDRQR